MKKTNDNAAAFEYLLSLQDLERANEKIKGEPSKELKQKMIYLRKLIESGRTIPPEKSLELGQFCRSLWKKVINKSIDDVLGAIAQNKLTDPTTVQAQQQLEKIQAVIAEEKYELIGYAKTFDNDVAIFARQVQFVIDSKKQHDAEKVQTLIKDLVLMLLSVVLGFLLTRLFITPCG